MRDNIIFLKTKKKKKHLKSVKKKKERIKFAKKKMNELEERKLSKCGQQDPNLNEGRSPNLKSITLIAQPDNC
jgi:hypothetical protein